MAPLHSITDRIFALRTGRTTSLKIVQHCLNQIDLWEDKVQAWVSIDRQGAIAEAKRLDALAESGRWAGLLHGIPIGIKDIIDINGFPTVAGSELRKASPSATDDATVVTRLRNAGAIILGKTVTTELACFDPAVTKNPWNLQCTPGGSSSGSAVAVATGMCLAAIGSQTGGSITRPASYCGVSGMKATFGRVSRNRVVMVSQHLDHIGPICRRVADLALVMRVIAGHDPKDSHTNSEPFLENSVNHKNEPVNKFKILDSWLRQSSPEVSAEMQTAIATLKNAGALFENIELPLELKEIIQQHRVIMATEMYQNHGQAFDQSPQQFGPNVSSLLREGKQIAPTVYQQALKHQQSLKLQMDKIFQPNDIWLTPATETTAPQDLTTTGSPRFNSPWSYLGLPTISIPCAVASDALPVSIQLIGKSNCEAQLIKPALWCERTLDFKQVATI